MIEKLPKKWQKFDDLLILPANIEYKRDLVSLAEKFKGESTLSTNSS